MAGQAAAGAPAQTDQNFDYVSFKRFEKII